MYNSTDEFDDLSNAIFENMLHSNEFSDTYSHSDDLLHLTKHFNLRPNPIELMLGLLSIFSKYEDKQNALNKFFKFYFKKI